MAREVTYTREELVDVYQCDGCGAEAVAGAFEYGTDLGTEIAGWLYTGDLAEVAEGIAVTPGHLCPTCATVIRTVLDCLSARRAG